MRARNEPEEEPLTADVVILGGGLAGVACARTLGEEGCMAPSSFCAWSGEVGRKRPCHGEPVPIDLRFQLHQATHREADHLGLLVAYDQQRGKPAEERHVADERKRLVLGLRSKPLRDRYHRVIRRKTRSSLDARLHADLPHKQLRSLLCAQLSAVQAAADPNFSSPGSLSATLHRPPTGIREGSLGIPCPC